MQPPILHPTHNLTVPTTKEKIKIRPYNVREEKVLAMAAVSKSPNDRIDAAIDILSHTVLDGNFNAKSASAIDIEFLLIHLRAKSVNEIIEDVVVTDPKSGKQHRVDVDLESIYIDPPIPEKTPKVQLTDEVGVTLRYPSFAAIRDFQGDMAAAGVDLIEDKFNENPFSPEGAAEAAFKFYSTMIVSIYTAEEVYPTKDMDPAELITWIGDLSKDQFGLLEEFFANSPRVKLDCKYTDRATKEERKTTLVGFEGFFTLSPAT